MGRIAYLDMVKLVTIYLVILGHVLAMMVDGFRVGSWLISLIYSFHMPLFMLLSGYFVSSKTLGLSFVELLHSKAKHLLLPSITCAAICSLYLFLFRNNANYRDEIIGNSWFLKTLFAYYLMFGLLKQTKMNDYVLMACSCILLFVIPHGSTLQINLLWPYFITGFILRKYNLLDRITNSWSVTFLFLSLFVVTYSFQRYLDIPNYIPINTGTLLSEAHLIIFRYVVAFCGCMSVVFLTALVYRYVGDAVMFKKLAKYGRYTLGVYVLQTILVINVFPDTLAWYVGNEWLLDLVIAPTLSVGFLGLCLCLIHILSKNKTLDLLFFGGQYYKR